MAGDSTVYIVDDDQAARESVMAMVRVKGYIVQGFSSAEDFLNKYRPDWSGCIVADVRMPGLSGIEFLQQIKLREIPLPVIVITGFADVQQAVQAMKAGALTFLEKPCQDQELVANIELALATGKSEQNQQRMRQELEARLLTLSEDERLVLTKLVAGFPNKRIATEMDLGLRTVELRRSNVMKKMGANSLAELIRMAIILELAPEPEF